MENKKTKKKLTGTALDFAGDWWWDQDYFVTTLNGRVNWETCAMTSGGNAIRLMRLDDAKDRAFRRYVKPYTKMKLVPK